MKLKTKHAYLIAIIFIFFSCKSNKKRDCKEVFPEADFDYLLKCERFSYNDFYFITADYGCPYNYKGNTYGNLTFYLIPKKVTEQLIKQEYAVYEDRIENLTIDALKSEFYIYVTVISKQFLVKTHEGYWQREPYVTHSYTYNNETKTWVFLDCITINDIHSEREKEQKWYNYITRGEKVEILKKQYDSIINLKFTVFKKHNEETNEISKKWQGTYSFDYGRTHMGQYTEGKVRFNITEDSQKVFLDEKEVNLTIKKAYKDSIILNQGDDYDYILFRIAPDKYAVKGHHIYMLSPPNEVQNLTKH